MRLEEYLGRCSRLVRQVIDQVLPSGAGTLPRASRHLIEAGGKMLRPCLCLSCCEAVGGKITEDVLKVAAALELVHTFTLVHDDIMDHAETRRGVPAVHVKWGEPIALTVGDALLLKAFKLLSEVPNSQAIIGLMAEATLQLCEGQVLDIEFSKRETVSEGEYLQMIERKTGALFSAATRAGALMGGAPPELAGEMAEYGRLVGMAFQIRDDVLDLLEKPESDLREGKRTLMIVKAMEDLQLRERLRDALGRRDLSIEEAREIQRLLVGSGAFDYAMEKARELAELAKSKLTGLPPSPAKDVLLELADLAVTRNR